MLLGCLSIIGGLLVSLTAAESKFTPARPPSFPLAVKSPYLSTWLPAGSSATNGGYLPGQWPGFWRPGQTKGWTGLIRVDGDAYTWMGAPQNIQTANQTSAEYTSTRSIFEIEVANKVTLNVTFLSPLTPTDMKRQSLTFSYMQVEVSSMDGASHQVELYTDISAEWVSGSSSDVAQWDFDTSGEISYHKVWKQTQELFTETNDQAEWGNVYYATDSTYSLTWESGADVDVRGAFVKNGKLANTKDTDFRAINSNWPVFGYAVDLGSVDATPTSTLFTVGLCQDEAFQYVGTNGLEILPPLYLSYFSDDIAALSFFHNDFSESSTLSSQFDAKVSGDSIAAAGQDYATMTTLAARQVLGATQLGGTTNDSYLFLKEISSDGNVNTVDVIFPAAPFFYYVNPDLMDLLLKGLFENQESGHYPNPWAMHDLGSNYPNATGHPDGNDEKMPLEECGNMIIMVLAYAQRASDTSYLKQHYPKLKQWVEYLVEESLYPQNQISTDDFAGPLANQTNLALKGMIGIAAMAQIASLTGEDADAKNYTSIAQSYIKQWQSLGFNMNDNPPHSIINYGNESTHGLLYNLYADRLLDTKLVPQSVYDIQSNFYPTVEDKYGVPLDTRNRYWTKSDWETFCAAIASAATQNMFISDIAKWINETPISDPLTDLYDTNDGGYPPAHFMARPVVGGFFALLALQK